MEPASIAEHPRPWIDHYPEGITWDVTLDVTPVHEQVIAACARNPSAIALDNTSSDPPPAATALVTTGCWK